MPFFDERAAARLHASAGADRWGLPVGRFSEALEAGAARVFAGRSPSARELDRYASSLHLEDLALACAAADGHEAAWELIVREYRPVLYRSADALDASGGAREVADSLYAELYGLQQQDGQRRSLFRYFHGRSSLATWLRSVLAQRYVDAIRSRRRLEPLPDEELRVAAPPSRDPDAGRYLALIERALRDAIAKLAARDRLRLGCYYARQLTLAETGRLLGEHEATVSRHVARTRKALRVEVERVLRTDAGLSPDEVARCFELALEDSGPLDLDRLFATTSTRKMSEPDRSQ